MSTGIKHDQHLNKKQETRRLSAFVAGVLENLLFWREVKMEVPLSLPMASVPMTACDGGACGCGHEQQTLGLWAKLRQGVRYAVTDI